MRRIGNVPIRTGWREENARLGLVYNDTAEAGASYWREGSCYAFTVAEIEQLARAATAIHSAMMEAGDHIAESCPRHRRQVRASAVLRTVCPGSGCLLSKIGVPEWAHEQVIRTWFDGDVKTWTAWDKDIDASAPVPETSDYSPMIYGRFDFRYSGDGAPKLLEYNGQTATSLLESSVIQWFWQEQTGASDHPERQWNNLHNMLVEAWQRNMARLVDARPWLDGKIKIYFAYERTETTGEDRLNTAYLQETARDAGFDTELICMDEIGHNMATDRIVHGTDGPDIDVIFALYPWEWIWHEEGGKPIFRDMADPRKRGTVWINPPYTAAIMGNKAILAVLWQLFADDHRYNQYLLPAFFAGGNPMRDYALKPIWGRLGNSIQLVEGGRQLEVNYGTYGREGFVAQQLCTLPAYEGVEGIMHPVIGVWMVDGEPAGMGIRESRELITGDTSHFVPHIIERDDSR